MPADDAGGVFYQLLEQLTPDARFEHAAVAGARPCEHGTENPDAQASQPLSGIRAQDHAGVVAGGRDVLFEADVAELLELGDSRFGDAGATADGAILVFSAIARVVVLDGEREVHIEVATGRDVGDGDTVTESASRNGRHVLLVGWPQYLSRY